MTQDQVLDLPIFSVPKWLVKKMLPTVYAKVREGRRDRLRDEGRLRAAVWNNKLYEIIGKIVAESGVYVRSGPFAGMMYWPVGKPHYWAGGVAPSLLGVYEMELHGVLDRILRRGYRQIIDIGAAEGYYAVGFALRLLETQIYAFDIDEAARQMCKAAALINGVADRIVIGGECTIDTLRQLTTTTPTLILSDCEGAELDLLRSDLAPGLADCDILVELHDVFRPGLTETLLPRFAETHRIEVIRTAPRDPDAFPELNFLSRDELHIVLDERRPAQMAWAMLTSRKTLGQ